jgi:hypothetical protein
MNARKSHIPVVTLKCVDCGAKKKVAAFPPPPEGVHFCDVCMSPMAVVKAERRT